MNFEQINRVIKDKNLALRPIGDNNRNFINGMFSDPAILKYYIVPKEAQQDYTRLVDYWLNDQKNEAGTCWIISVKSSGLFSNDVECGFIAFEFRDTLKNARVSYAILPKHRKKGIATKSLELIIDLLKSQGIERIEADIDRDNLNSEKVVEKLCFTTNKKQALVDPEMMRDGEIRFRALWKKELADLNSVKLSGRIPLDAKPNQLAPLFNQIVEEIKTKGQHPALMLRYLYLLGRIKFLEGNFDEAKQAFGQCNMITMHEGFPELHETYFWFAKISEANGESGKFFYEFALENYHENPDYISKEEIESELIK